MHLLQKRIFFSAIPGERAGRETTYCQQCPKTKCRNPEGLRHDELFE
jgi:hypothetical protein